MRYADRAKELTKPAVPIYLLEEARAINRKRRFAAANIPPTPANWKRLPLSSGSVMKMNNTIETPTPSKRLKVLAQSRLDTGHSLTFATPSETPSDFQTASSYNGGSAFKKNLLASAVKRNMDKMLQDIEEENGGFGSSVTNHLEDETLQADDSPVFGSEISSISPYARGSKPIACLSAEKHFSSMASPNLTSNALIRSSVKALNTTNLNNATLIDVSTLSPMIRKITDQVGKQFEKHFR